MQTPYELSEELISLLDLDIDLHGSKELQRVKAIIRKHIRDTVEPRIERENNNGTPASRDV